MTFYDAIICCNHEKLTYLRLIFHRTQCTSKRVVCSQAAAGIFLGADLAAKANGIFFSCVHSSPPISGQVGTLKLYHLYYCLHFLHFI